MDIQEKVFKILFVDDEEGLCNEFKEYVSNNTNIRLI